MPKYMVPFLAYCKQSRRMLEGLTRHDMVCHALSAPVSKWHCAPMNIKASLELMPNMATSGITAPAMAVYLFQYRKL